MPSLATASPAKRAAPSLKTGRSASPNTFARRIYHTPIGRVGSDAQRARLDFTQRQMLRSGAVVRMRHLMRLNVHTHKATGAVTPAALACTKETHPEPERGAHTHGNSLNVGDSVRRHGLVPRIRICAAVHAFGTRRIVAQLDFEVPQPVRAAVASVP